MENNAVTELMRVLNWAEYNDAPETAAAAREALAKAMAPVITAHPFPLAS